MPPTGIHLESSHIASLSAYAGNDMVIADGVRLFPFLILKAAVKALKKLGKSVKEAEFLIINGNDILTESILDVIYPYINYLTIITENQNKFGLKDYYIFEETGLDIRFSRGSKGLVALADVVINTRVDYFNYDFAYKRNAVFFDLSMNRSRQSLLAAKRKDMQIIDSIKVCYKNTSMSLGMLELAVYLKCREYEYLATKGYNEEFVDIVYEFIDKMNIAITGIYPENR